MLRWPAVTKVAPCFYCCVIGGWRQFQLNSTRNRLVKVETEKREQVRQAKESPQYKFNVETYTTKFSLKLK